MQYKIIVDKQSRTNPSSEKKEYVIDIEELRVKGDVYDSLVITKDEDYVMRRLSLSEYHVLTELETPKKEPLKDITIELFEGDNYIYLVDMVGNKFYAEYIVKNDFTDIYVTTNEMNSAINQTAQSIELSVNQKLTGYSTTEEMNSAINIKANEITSSVSSTYATKNELSTAKSEIKQTTDSITSTVSKKVGNDELCSKISQSADKIELIGNRITITSSKFKLTETGEVSVVDGSFKVISSEGTKLMDFSSSGIRYYNNNGEEIGALVSTQQDNGRLFLTLHKGTTLYISKTSDDGSYFTPMFSFNDINDVPYIRNTASGTVFPSAGGGIEVENGLIKNWNITAANDDLPVLLPGATSTAVIHVRNGLITGWDFI